jgi:hypothetical protein
MNQAFRREKGWKNNRAFFRCILSTQVFWTCVMYDFFRFYA